MAKRTPKVEAYRSPDRSISFGHDLDLVKVVFTDGKKRYPFYGESSDEATKYAKIWARKHKVKLERVPDDEQ